MDENFGVQENIFDIKRELRGDLTSDEKLLWTGQPDPKVIFSPADIILIPFGLVWAGFACFWEWNALSMFFSAGGFKPGVFSLFSMIFPVFGLPFVYIGFQMVIGRFFSKALKRKRTWYAATNKRVIMLIRSRDRLLWSLYYKDKLPVNKYIKPDGSGSVFFIEAAGAPVQMIPDPESFNFGWPMGGRNRGKAVFTAFYDIPEADKVYNLINDQNKQPAQPAESA